MSAPGRALVILAHPDDAEFLAGGTIAAWTRAGTEVAYVCATDGSAGWNEPGRTRDEIARIREKELQEAAEVLGVSLVAFLGYPDGSLQPTLDLRRDVTREVRRFRPDVIVGPDPSKLWAGRSYINHPDHRAIGEAVLAVVACDAPTRPQFPELLDEGLEPYKVPAVWLATFDGEGDTKVDIEQSMDAKCDALRIHASQMENMALEDIDTRMRQWAAEAGDGKLVESFRTFSLED